MTIKERILQAVLFETLAILLSLGWVKLLSFFALQKTQSAHVQSAHVQSTHDGKVLLMLMGISLMAMIWTFIYNLLFDKCFVGDKLARPVWLRVLHIVGFEAGLLCFTLPLVMWVMGIGLWQAFVLDISLTLLVLAYGFGFYWVYDVLRAKYCQR